MNRLTHPRNNGIKSGYWSPNKKDDLIERLAAYENTELSPAQIEEMCDLYGDKCAELVQEQKKHRWIPVEERLPENEEIVEITYIRKGYRTGELRYLTARAFYENGTMNTDDSRYCWYDTGNWEHDEETDSRIIPEGWWEGFSFSEEFGSVDMPVIAWMPLPEPYRPEKPKAAGRPAADHADQDTLMPAT